MPEKVRGGLMIKVFGQTDKVFTSNGDIVLRPLKAKVHKKDNGDYYLDLETSLDYVDYIVEGNIVTANTPTGDQAFRIGNVTKSKTKIVTKAYHVFYDSQNYLIEDAYVVDKNANDALNHLNASTEPQSEFTTFSDIETIDSYRCVRQSLYEAIQEVVGRYGGHLVRDNFSIALMANIGHDNGITIQYKKNLRDISCQENWSNVVTKLLPVGKDGILLNAINPEASIYVTSERQYALPYTKTVAFSQDNVNQDDYETEEEYTQALVDDLYAQATAYVEYNSVPQVNYTLKANLDRVTDIGDTVEVIDDRLGINMMTNVIGFEYDCIFEKYTEVEFGNFSNTLSGFANKITSSAEKIAGEKAQSIEDNIMSIMTRSYVMYDGAQILILDSLPKEDAENVIKVTSDGIGFSQTGINGEITSKWDIDGNLTLAQDLDVTGDTSLANLSIAGDEVNDFIVASGVTDGWSWTRTQKGHTRARRRVSVDSSTLSWSSFQNLNMAQFSVSYPLSNPIVTATLESCPDVGWIASTGGGTFTIIREGTTGTFTVDIEISD